MWIKDNWGRLVNSDNILYIEIKDDNEGKKTQNPSWTLKARMVKSDMDRGLTLHLTEGHREKAEAQMRSDAIVDAIKKGWNYLELE